MSTYEDIRVNSNIPVKWSISGSVNVKDIEKKDTYYIFQISIPGTAYSAMIYVEGKTNAGQTGKVTYKIVEPR